jgi:NCS1 family nucleobase:cation symporter-1
MTWITQAMEACSSRHAFLKAIETKKVDGENKGDYNEDLLPTEPGKSAA